MDVFSCILNSGIASKINLANMETVVAWKDKFTNAFV